MIVVCDTSPLTSLAAIGRFDLLRGVYSELHLADAVLRELSHGDVRWPGAEEVATATWIHHHKVTNVPLVVALTRDLDRGEAETIALGLEIGADLVLIDEREGRRAAERLGLRVAGVLGTLLMARRRGLIPEVRPCLEDLRRTGFYVDSKVFRAMLLQAGEQ